MVRVLGSYPLRGAKTKPMVFLSSAREAVHVERG